MNDTTTTTIFYPIGNRFRGYLPVVVDVETAGFDAESNALLEVAAVILSMNAIGQLEIVSSHQVHIKPFEGAKLNPESLAYNKIDPYHPFRLAVDEYDGLNSIFNPIREAVKINECSRAILVGHNAFFDLGFINAAVKRAGVKRCPFHAFSNFDTVSLAGLVYGETVLARAVKAAGFDWDSDSAHSAIYDAERTAMLFCNIVNKWSEVIGVPRISKEIESQSANGNN